MPTTKPIYNVSNVSVNEVSAIYVTENHLFVTMKIIINLALPCFKTTVGFIDNINPPFTANDTAIAVATLQRL